MSEERRLRILMLEDVPADAELIEWELRKKGLVFSSRRVETRDGFISALDEFGPDVILADNKLPSFDGLSALDIAKAKCPEAPFIFVTGSMGEELAIDTIKRGATDYVLKERLSKLEPAVRRAMLEADEHRRRMAAEEEVRIKTRQIAENEEKLRLIFEGLPDAMVVISEDDTVLFVNPSAERLFDRPSAAFVGTKFGFPVVGKETCEIEVLLKNGSLRTAEMYLADIEWDGEKVFLISIRDITERKRAEESLRMKEADLREAQRVARVGNWELNCTTGAVTWSEEIFRIFGIDPKQTAPSYEEHSRILTSESKSKLDAAIAATLQSQVSFEIDLEIVRQDCSPGWITARGEIRFMDHAFTLLRGTALDITDRKKAEEDLRLRIEELERFRNATIKREFRIKELKDRLKELETEIAGLKTAQKACKSSCLQQKQRAKETEPCFGI